MLTRRALLTSVLLSPAIAYANPPRRPDGGMSGIPLRDPDSITADDIDTLMWPIVQQINKSKWIWTTESCQGHKPFNHPMLGLMTNDLGRAFSLLSESFIDEASVLNVSEGINPTTVSANITYFVKSRVRASLRYQFRITIHDSKRGLDVFTRFSKKVLT